MDKRRSEFNDFLGFHGFLGADYLESCNLVAYASDELMLRDLSSGEEKRITAGGRREGTPRFSPDGERLLFLSSAEQGRQAYCYDLCTEEVTKVTSMRTPVIDPVWSPDGKKILFASPSGGSGGPVREHMDEAVVIDELGYKFDGFGFYTPDSHMHLYITDVETGATVQVTQGPYNYMHHNWSSDGRSVICCSNRFRDQKRALAMDLLMIEAGEHGDILRLTEDKWLVSYPNPLRPAPTPDGKYIVAGFLELPEGGVLEDDSTYPEVYLYKVRTDGSGYECIFQPSEECYQCVQFPYNASCGAGMDKMKVTDDGKEVIFHGGWNGQCRLYGVSIDGGKARVIHSGKDVVHGITSIQNGKALIAVSSETVPERYEIIDVNTGYRQRTGIQSGKKLIESVAFSQPEEFFVDTSDGEGKVHAWVMPPQKMDPHGRYPAILYIHGGPHPFYTYGFTHEYQCFAGAGYAVIYCNPRGSSSYGLEHQEMEKAYDGRAFEDCLQVVDEACRMFSWIDPDRIGVTGGSYGGYMVNFMATHCHRFNAYISQRSIADELISYGSSDMYRSSREYKCFADFMKSQLEKSPVSYAERVDRPFLILHGAEDLRTPVEGVEQFFYAIRRLHPELPARMVLYPGTAHDQPEDPVMAEHYFHEMLNWFDTYL